LKFEVFCNFAHSCVDIAAATDDDDDDVVSVVDAAVDCEAIKQCS